MLVTVVFFCDVCVQFFLPVPKKGSSERGDSAYERRHWRLTKRYLLGFFWIDVVTIIPFDVLVWQGVLTGEVKMIKILRVMRLLKVAKVLRASTIIQRWENSIAIQSTKQTLGGFGTFTIILVHWFACFWSLLAQVLQSPQREGREGALEAELRLLVELRGDECTGCLSDDTSTLPFCEAPCLSECEREALASVLGEPIEFIFHSEAWTCRAAVTGHLTSNFADEPAAVYCTALLVAMLQLVGSVSTIVPSNVGEYLFFFTAILIGTVLIAARAGHHLRRGDQRTSRRDLVAAEPRRSQLYDVRHEPAARDAHRRAQVLPQVEAPLQAQVVRRPRLRVPLARAAA
jgi:hypothetical protein